MLNRASRLPGQQTAHAHPGAIKPILDRSLVLRETTHRHGNGSKNKLIQDKVREAERWKLIEGKG